MNFNKFGKYLHSLFTGLGPFGIDCGWDPNQTLNTPTPFPPPCRALCRPHVTCEAVRLGAVIPSLLFASASARFIMKRREKSWKLPYFYDHNVPSGWVALLLFSLLLFFFFFSLPTPRQAGNICHSPVASRHSPSPAAACMQCLKRLGHSLEECEEGRGWRRAKGSEDSNSNIPRI